MIQTHRQPRLFQIDRHSDENRQCRVEAVGGRSVYSRIVTVLAAGFSSCFLLNSHLCLLAFQSVSDKLCGTCALDPAALRRMYKE